MKKREVFVCKNDNKKKSNDREVALTKPLTRDMHSFVLTIEL